MHLFDPLPREHADVAESSKTEPHLALLTIPHAFFLADLTLLAYKEKVHQSTKL